MQVFKADSDLTFFWSSRSWLLFILQVKCYPIKKSFPSPFLKYQVSPFTLLSQSPSPVWICITVTGMLLLVSYTPRGQLHEHRSLVHLLQTGTPGTANMADTCLLHKCTMHYWMVNTQSTAYSPDKHNLIQVTCLFQVHFKQEIMIRIR